MSRYDHFKAIFSRHSSPEREIKGDTTSEITLVPQYDSPNYTYNNNRGYHNANYHSRQTQPTRYYKRGLPQNYNGEYPNSHEMICNIS